MTKRDYYLGALTGFLTGLFAIPIIWNIGSGSVALSVALPLVIAPLFAFGVWLGGFLSRFLAIMSQVGKFAAVGFLNTAVNFGILNIASIITGINSGLLAGAINIPATIAASLNSYGWNKFWVFKNAEPAAKTSFRDAVPFAAVTILGLLVNSAVLAFFTSYWSPVLGLNAEAWLNVGKVIATVGSAVVNFVGYKFFVFKPKA